MAKPLVGLSFEQAVEKSLLLLKAESRETAVRTSRLAKFMASNGAAGKTAAITDQLSKFTQSRFGKTLGRYVGGAKPGSPDNLEWAILKRS
jgi:hypothetical protein